MEITDAGGVTKVISKLEKMVNLVASADGVICPDTHRELLHRSWKPIHTFVERIYIGLFENYYNPSILSADLCQVLVDRSKSTVMSSEAV